MFVYKLVYVGLSAKQFIFFFQDYIAVKEKYSKYLPHSAGRYQLKRFRKAQCPIVERLVCSLMMHGRNNGKKLMTMRVVKHAFEIIHLLTGEVSNQLQSEYSCFLCHIKFHFSYILNLIWVKILYLLGLTHFWK